MDKSVLFLVVAQILQDGGRLIVRADVYENFTDVDIFAAHLGYSESHVPSPSLLTVKMRESACAGFTVLHDEALLPAYHGKIPLVIKNTNNPVKRRTKNRQTRCA